jgi:hypothetical protein
MSCFVGGGSGRENLMYFFPAKKAQDVMVNWKKVLSAHAAQRVYPVWAG